MGRSLAIARRRAASLRAEAAARLSFRQADLGALDRLAPAWLASDGPAVLAIDVGCFHALATDAARDGYARGLATLLAPGATLLLYGFDERAPGSPFGRLAARLGSRLGLREGEVATRFGRVGLALEAVARGEDSGRPSAWYALRKPPGRHVPGATP
ncbi:MAG: hypothetical protein A2X23_07145 [Chloroflexi bacterium GWC2_73_18]|nr:MAG: hypothetical protein A2X23_07145 [Chloroflexi bacterium GWC2_73_18]